MDTFTSWFIPLALGGGAGALAMTLFQGSRISSAEQGTPELAPVRLPEVYSPRPGALILLDVDAMAAMNAEYGPDIGDRVLERIADVIRRTLPQGGALERLDGGRFVIWLSSGDAEQASELADELRKSSFRATVETGRGRIGRSVSAGVVQMDGDAGRARALMAAESAMARAKKLGGNRIALATATVDPTGPTADEIQDAIRSGAIGYHVQPVFDLKSRKAKGVEALLRWTRPDGQVLPPSDFLHRINALPEDVSAIFADLAVKAAKPFVTGPEPLFFGLNLTGGALDEQGSQSRDWLYSVIERLPADRVVLELLESAVVTNPQTAMVTIQHLRNLGVRIALDDFGTGLSNLDRILDLKPEIIKLDRSFVTRLKDSGGATLILQQMAQLGRELDIVLVVEGLETADEVAEIQRMGFRRGQGFHLGRPMPVAYWADKLM